ncbi:MAG: 4-phosphoerythronate dehydrogenase [Duncaniella sp.]|nr:4-phosphoerythronate dehydrogenase [Duncaniella sp.]
MKTVIDRNIPFIAGPLAALGEVVSLSGDAITPEVMADADILLTRTRTRCDARLLEGSPCRFIGTATIGTDHIDMDYCAANGITVANAPGCNAPAVAQWVMAAIRAHIGPDRPLSDVTLGVIGAGNVGSIVVRWAKHLGMKVLVNDPPLQASEPGRHKYSSLAEIAHECDVITVHTPLTAGGEWPTRHLIGEDFVRELRRRPLIMNAARGPVSDTRALLAGLDAGLIGNVAIDCWEGEPDINKELLRRALIATPHIAGYSRQGKIRASQMVLDALSSYLSLPTTLRADAPAVAPVPEKITEPMVGYDILTDTEALKTHPEQFEALRNSYHLREEPA